MTIPNFITILRLLLVPVVIWSMATGHMMLALVGFIIAGVSDGVDGFIARRFDMRSELGTYLDPIADKLLLVSVFIALVYIGAIPVWLVVLVVSRDAMIVSGVMLSTVMGNPVEVRPLFVSKANTAAQIVLVAVILGQLAFSANWDVIGQPLIIIVAILTVASAMAYLVTWLRHMADDDEKTG